MLGRAPGWCAAGRPCPRPAASHHMQGCAPQWVHLPQLMQRGHGIRAGQAPESRGPVPPMASSVPCAHTAHPRRHAHNPANTPSQQHSEGVVPYDTGLLSRLQQQPTVRTAGDHAMVSFTVMAASVCMRALSRKRSASACSRHVRSFTTDCCACKRLQHDEPRSRGADLCSKELYLQHAVSSLRPSNTKHQTPNDQYNAEMSCCGGRGAHSAWSRLTFAASCWICIARFSVGLIVL